MPPLGPGLYCWVAGSGLEPMEDPMEGGVLHVGIGEGARGCVGRVAHEMSVITQDAAHGHGVAMRRTGAVVVGGPVDRDATPSLSWMTDLVSSNDLHVRGATKIHDWLQRQGPGTILRTAEECAIRLSIHVGDVGAPVNSLHKGAWASDRGDDWAAYATAVHLRRTASLR